jgi:hypothetical protein
MQLAERAGGPLRVAETTNLMRRDAGLKKGDIQNIHEER